MKKQSCKVMKKLSGCVFHLLLDTAMPDAVTSRSLLMKKVRVSLCSLVRANRRKYTKCVTAVCSDITEMGDLRRLLASE
jgi:hypothetical protein